MLIAYIKQDISLTMRQATSWVTPLLFFIIVVCLFPLALGSETALLNSAAPSIIWVTVLLAILLSLNQLFHADKQEGFLDLLILSPIPISLLVLCKIVSHWITHCLPLICLSPLLGLILHLNLRTEWILITTLLLGTPVLILLGSIGAALTIGIQGNGLLLPILIMPFYIPVLIFGTGTLTAANLHLPLAGYFAVMSAFILLSLAFAPLLAGLALRIGVNQ